MTYVFSIDKISYLDLLIKQIPSFLTSALQIQRRPPTITNKLIVHLIQRLLLGINPPNRLLRYRSQAYGHLHAGRGLSPSGKLLLL